MAGESPTGTLRIEGAPAASVEDQGMKLHRTVCTWRLRTRSLELGRRTVVMGVVNVTPDSFSDGVLFLDPDVAVERGMRLLDEGADLLDLGAESTRPGSRAGGDHPAVSAEEEWSRLRPVLEGIRSARPDAVLSVDTYKAATARAALASGAEIINDVSGLMWDAEMAGICAGARCGVVLMHTRNRPEDWKKQAQLPPDDVLELVRAGLAASLEKATGTGIESDAVVLDPGYGFGKKFDENYALLARQDALLSLGRPLLAGLSRKSFLGRPLAAFSGGQSAPVAARETASVAAMVAAILQGASLVRVHEVRPALEAVRIADAVLEADR